MTRLRALLARLKKSQGHSARPIPLPRWRWTRWLSGCERDLPEEVLTRLVDGPVNQLPMVLAGMSAALLVTAVAALSNGSPLWIFWTGMQLLLLGWRLELHRRLHCGLPKDRARSVDGIVLLQILWAVSLGGMAVSGLLTGGPIAVMSISIMLVVASLWPSLCIGRPRLSLLLVLLCDLPLKLSVPFQSEALYWVFVVEGPIYWWVMDWFARHLSQQTEASLISGYRSRQEADYDQLTQLYSRQGFYRAVKSLRRRMAEPVPMALLYLDLDGFKNVNDRLGHEAGDKLLERIAESFREVVRDDDVIARWGGDEFLLLLPGADDETPGLIAERLLSAIRRLRDQYALIDASIGISRLADSRELTRDGLEQLLRRADRALYRAKHSGKGGFRVDADLD